MRKGKRNGTTQSVDAATSTLVDTILQKFRHRANAVRPERRVGARQPFSHRVTVRTCDADGSNLGEEIEAQGCDLSVWGMRLVAPRRLSAGQYVALNFRYPLPGRERNVSMLGEVRHARASAPGLWEIGCAFRLTRCAR